MGKMGRRHGILRAHRRGVIIYRISIPRNGVSADSCGYSRIFWSFKGERAILEGRGLWHGVI